MAFDYSLNVVRNASPYWSVKLWSGEQSKVKLSRKEAAYLGVGTDGSIKDNIVRKISSIKFKDMFNAKGKVDRNGEPIDAISGIKITFSNLTLDEAESAMFDIGIGFSVFAGWFDFWSFRDVANDHIFDGIVSSLTFSYDRLGITIELSLISPGTIPFYQPITKRIFDGKERTFIDAMTKICDYCGMGGILKITNYKLKAYFQGNIWAYRPWNYLPKRIRDEKTGKWRMKTPHDIIEHLADRYGQVYNIKGNELYFGTPEGYVEPGSKPKKMFDYRSQHRDQIPPSYFTHLNYDTFDRVTLMEAEGVKSKSRGVTFYNRDFKEPKNSVEKENVRISRFKRNPLLEQQFQSHQPGIQDAIDILRNKAYRTKGSVEDQIKATQSELEPMSGSVQATSEEEAAAMNSGQLAYGALGMVMIRVHGALGDSTFNAGDKFMFKAGSTHHSGYYLADSIEHTWSANRWMMNIVGRKTRTPEEDLKAYQKMLELEEAKNDYRITGKITSVKELTEVKNKYRLTTTKYQVT